ncbi:Ger(x)C family spore germination protein [Paenibacillus sp. NFR01]|uniref:Ger(x)C family spore germination protein n=1 Tax=Paenibacillus sp. NFR01 TaxID=1566279 RepID=UPI0008D1307C|nr:Ger(x)C family spore germination protein [Paenibacillus sp. NFR01]SET25179.1 spore germination protein KC [Paenibacillus sp. NFR01]
MQSRLRKTVISMLLLLFLPMLLSGCWERRELNELAFVLALGLDKAEAGYKVTMQVVIPSSMASQTSGGAGGSGVPVISYSFPVATVYESLRKFNLTSSRSSYLGHIRVLVIGEALAREGVADTLDVLKRSREPRMDFYVMVARNNTAENVLNVLTPLDKLPASKLFNALDKSYKVSAKTVAVTLDKFIEDLLYKGKDPILTGIEIQGDAQKGGEKSNTERTSPNARLRYESVAVFKKDKMIGWLDDTEAIGCNYINNNVTKNTGIVKGEDGKWIVIEALTTTTRRKVKFIDGEPHIFLEVKAISNVEEIQGTDRLDTEKIVRKLEEKAEARIIGRMEQAIEQVNKRYNVDIFGFGQSIYRANPKAWARLQERKGDDYLKTLPVHITADVTINRVGTIDNSFIDQIEE